MSKKIKVGIVGLRFGGEFPNIYRDHPDVEAVAICDKDVHLLHQYGEKFGFDTRYSNYDDLLNDEIDAIHILTDIHTHYDLTIKALESGKHCACTVPMATNLDQIRNIIRAQKKSGKNYMMMETAVYTYHCLFVKDLIDQGKIGRIQYLRGTHFQDMEGWPDYWMGLPPMHYATHAVSPLLYLSKSRATKVHCFGSGIMTEELVKRYGNPYPVEVAIMLLENEQIAAEFARSLFHTAREYVEGFAVFGESISFEWNIEDEDPYIFELSTTQTGGRGKEINKSRIQLPDFRDRLPESIRKYTKEHTILDPNNPHASIKQGGGHHGSHPHLVHEFVRSIVEERKPMIDAITAANWTAPGICAHESAMQGGKGVVVPSFE